MARKKRKTSPSKSGSSEPAGKKTSTESRRNSTPLWLVLAVGAVAIVVGAYFFVGKGAREVPHGALQDHNLLFITIDTLRADRLGAYGSSEGLTPYLDRLAREGIVFEDVLAHVPLTLPSHTSIFTGKYPTGHGVHDNGTFRLDEAQPTLASRLKEQGYDTAAFVGAFVLDARFGLNQGFDLYDDYYGEKRAFLSFVELERRGEEVVAAAEPWVTETHDKPWFAWVHLFDPHTPYLAPEPFRSERPQDPYGAEVAYVDQTLGTFLQRLDTGGVLDRTLVVVAGDHGESLGQHGELTHGTFAYNATLSVPLIFWAKQLPPGSLPDRVRHVDVAPTVLDLLGLPPAADSDGQTLRTFLHGAESYEPPSTYFEALNPNLTRDWAPLRGVVEGDYKFIDLPIVEIYDLANDPGEERNIAQGRARLASDMRTVLEQITSNEEAIRPTDVDEETRRRLAALGYVVAPKSSEGKMDYSEGDDPKGLIAISNTHDEAGDLFSQGRREEALELLRDLLAQQPRSSFAYQKLAYALRQTDRTEEAVEVLEQALENGVSDLALQALLGSYLIEVGDAAKAKGLLELLTETHPDYAEGHNYLGVAYNQLGRSADARREFERVIELDPSSAMARNNLGSLELRRGNRVGAIDNFEAALELDPELSSANNGLGVANAQAGDMEAAIEYWRRAVELNPRHFDAMFNLAIALYDVSPVDSRPYLERFAAQAPPGRYQDDIQRARALLAANP